MSSWITAAGRLLNRRSAAPTGDAGLALQENIDSLDPWIMARAPTANDDGANTGGAGATTPAQIWINTATSPATIYICASNATSAAVWDKIYPAPISATAPLSNVAGTIAIAAATDSAAGSMSGADKTKFDAATSVNTASTLVERDGSSNINATTFTAADGVIVGAASSSGVTGLSAPVNQTDAVSQAWVTNLIAGLANKADCACSTTANLTATYSNGTAGVGATLTATGNGAFPAQDGVTITSASADNRVLVQFQTAELQNGIYALTQTGDGSHPWILTRTADMDTSAQFAGAWAFVAGGATYGGYFFWCNPASFTVGTTSVSFTQLPGTALVAGAGIAISGGTVSNTLATATQDVDLVFAGPPSGSPAAPTWRLPENLYDSEAVQSIDGDGRALLDASGESAVEWGEDELSVLGVGSIANYDGYPSLTGLIVDYAMTWWSAPAGIVGQGNVGTGETVLLSVALPDPGFGVFLQLIVEFGFLFASNANLKHIRVYCGPGGDDSDTIVYDSDSEAFDGFLYLKFVFSNNGIFQNALFDGTGGIHIGTMTGTFLIASNKLTVTAQSSAASNDVIGQMGTGSYVFEAD